MQGECTPLEVSFNVYDDNKMPIHFYKLTKQLPKVISQVTPADSYVVNNKLEEVRGVPDSPGQESGLPGCILPDQTRRTSYPLSLS
jgi:hypothetical protein